MLRNIGSNIVGTILPSAAALVAVPLLISGFGIETFGIFSLQVAALFFFGLSDFGISRAIVLLSFDNNFSGIEGWRRPYRIGLRYSFILGAATTALGLLVGFALLFWRSAAANSADLAISTGLILAGAGITLVSQAPRAVLEAQQRFFLANVIRGPSAALIFLGPLITLNMSKTLTAAAIGILLTRLASAACYFWAAGTTSIKTLAGDRAVHRVFLRKAGWLGMTNVLSMLTAYLDRFVLGFFGSATMVGQYVIAQEVVTKLWISSGAVMSAAMPRLAAQRDEPGGRALRHTTRQLIAIMTIAGVMPSMLLILAGGSILKVWLGANFDPVSVMPLMIMSVGLGINSLTQINFALLQVRGGERRTAYLQVFNVTFMCLSLPVLILIYGINGAALGFTARLCVDTLLVRILLNGLGTECKKEGIGAFGLIAALVFLSSPLIFY